MEFYCFFLIVSFSPLGKPEPPFAAAPLSQYSQQKTCCLKPLPVSLFQRHCGLSHQLGACPPGPCRPLVHPLSVLGGLPCLLAAVGNGVKRLRPGLAGAPRHSPLLLFLLVLSGLDPGSRSLSRASGPGFSGESLSSEARPQPPTLASTASSSLPDSWVELWPQSPSRFFSVSSPPTLLHCPAPAWSEPQDTPVGPSHTASSAGGPVPCCRCHFSRGVSRDPGFNDGWK